MDISGISSEHSHDGATTNNDQRPKNSNKVKGAEEPREQSLATAFCSTIRATLAPRIQASIIAALHARLKMPA